jgi:serine/threonine protein kinase
LNLVLKDRPINRNSPRANGLPSSSKVSINGGTSCYQAPELFKKKAKFSRKADVFAAGVVFLELLTLQKPNFLWDDLYPGVLEVKLPAVLLKCFSNSLDPDPEKRMHFTELLVLLRSREGISIRELELGSPALMHSFDEVAADIRLMMPSSQYSFKSNIVSRGSEESSYISSRVTQA